MPDVEKRPIDATLDFNPESAGVDETRTNTDVIFASPKPIYTQQIESRLSTPLLCVRHKEEVTLERFLPSSDTIDIVSRRLHLSSRGRSVHGVCSLPPRDKLAILPSGAKVDNIDGHKVNSKDVHSSRISSSYNFSTALIAIFQPIYASITLYNTRGNQIQQHGYPAFGFSVTPYLVMSIVNLISAVLTPDFADVYLLKSEVLEEASLREGARFEGLVGSIKPDESQVNAESFDTSFQIGGSGRIFMLTTGLPQTALEQIGTKDNGDPVAVKAPGLGALEADLLQRHRLIIRSFPPFEDHSGGNIILFSRCSYIIGTLPIAIIGALSCFQPGRSTAAQRVWTMMWLVFGIFLEPMFSPLMIGPMFGPRSSFFERSRIPWKSNFR